MAKRLFFTCLIVFFMATGASAEPYFSLGGMWVDLRDADTEIDGIAGTGPRLSFKNGWGGLLAFGQQVSFLRLEAEAAYRRNDIDASTTFDEGKVEAMSGMINAYATFNLFHHHPFIGGGAGKARIKENLRGAGSDSDDVFAWQGLAGFSFPLNPGWLDIGYRYFTADDPEINDVPREYETHNVYMALRF